MSLAIGARSTSCLCLALIAAPQQRLRWPANGEPRTPNTQPPAVPGSGATGGGGAEHSSSFADTTIVGLPLCLLVN